MEFVQYCANMYLHISTIEHITIVNRTEAVDEVEPWNIESGK